MNKKGFVESTDTVIISDLLYYAWNKLKSLPLNDVIATCNQFYADETYVFNEKKRLYDAIGESFSGRNQAKRQKNIEDICATMLRIDSKNSFLPKFASVNLNNIPLNDNGNPTLGQIMAAINDIKRNAVTKNMLTKSLNELKREFSSGASFDIPNSNPDGPLSPAPVVEGSANDNVNSNEETSTSTNLFLSVAPLHVPALLAPSAPSYSQISSAFPPTSEGGGGGDGTGDGGVGTRGGGSGGGGGVIGAPGGGGGRAGGVRQMRGGELPTNRSNGKSANRKRDSSRPRTIIGKSVSQGLVSVKGADLTINKYVGRFHNDVVEEDVRKFIEDKGVTVVELEPLDTKHQRFKSFRLRFKRGQLDKIEDGDFWPEGVIVSPFFRPRPEVRPGVVIGASASSLNSS